MHTYDFICLNCGKNVFLDQLMGTVNRNHCCFCLWSKHVDLDIPGDRKSKCLEKMKPIGLTFKQEGKDKWGKEKQGELMLIHQCISCDKISINRIAGDDTPKKILEVLTISQNLDQETQNKLAKSQIKLLNNDDLLQIKQQLYGEKI